MNIKALILVALALAAFTLAACSGSEPPTQTASVSNTPTIGEVAITQYSRPPAMSIDAAKSYTATLKTNHGEVTIELFASDAPVTVNNFIFLAKENFYDGVIFHRVIDGFMIQGGDPHRHWDRRPGLQVPGRNRPFHHLRRARPAGDGQLGPRDQRQPVLHHRHADTAPQRQPHHLRQGYGRL